MRFKPNKTRVFGDVTNVQGVDLLHLFHGLFANIDPDYLVDRKSSRYLKIEEVKPSGRAVLVRTESGPFGEPGQTIDVTTHKVAHRRTEQQSATVMTRTLFVVPPSSTMGLFLVERQGSANGGSTLVEVFKNAMLASFPDHFFPTETVVESDAWSASANLAGVTAVAYGYPVDIANGTTPQPIVKGVLRQTLEPEHGARYLPRALWDAIRNHRVDTAAYMGFGSTQVDETIVHLEKNGQSKSFVLGKESEPSVRVEITKQEEAPLTDSEFVTRALAEAKSFYTEAGLTWNSTWASGAWTKSALDVKLDPR